MADRLKIAEQLDPLLAQVSEAMAQRGEHDPLALVQERLTRLIDGLRLEPPTVDKMRTLGELGFLKEHSLREELSGFHQGVQEAIDETMSPGWQ